MFCDGLWACLRQCQHCQSDLMRCAPIIKVTLEFVVKVRDMRANTAPQVIPCTGWRDPLNFTINCAVQTSLTSSSPLSTVPVPSTQEHRNVEMQRQNTQCKDTRCNAGCSAQQQPQTIRNANTTKGATPWTQPSKCAKHRQRQRCEMGRGRVWSSRQTTSTQLSTYKRLRCEEEGERNLFL